MYNHNIYIMQYILNTFSILNVLKYSKINFLTSSRVEKVAYLYILYIISKYIGNITSISKKEIKIVFFYVKKLSL